MRCWCLAAIFVAGCFTEAPTVGSCRKGEAACDCNPDGTCDAGHECVASIDKCIPTGCTSGTQSCTCVDDECLGTLVCSGGVCVPPDGVSTGADASISDSVADATISSTTLGTMSDPVMTEPTDTTPVDSSTTDMPGTASSDPSDPSDPSVDATTVSDTGPLEPCPACILLADDACERAITSCETDAATGGCNALMQCITGGNPVGECCLQASTKNAVFLWNQLLACEGLDQVCEPGCAPVCG